MNPDDEVQFPEFTEYCVIVLVLDDTGGRTEVGCPNHSAVAARGSGFGSRGMRSCRRSCGKQATPRGGCASGRKNG